MDDRHQAGSGARRAAGFVIVLAAATALRVATYAEIKRGPVLYLHTWTESDMNFFDGWARAIVAGDVLTRDDRRPYHQRHRKLACEALAHRDPEAVCDEAVIKRIWDGWVGPNTFWQDPLYPYALSVLYKLIGRNPHVTYAVQAALGVACVMLAYEIAAALFGGAAAVATGLLAVVFGPLLFYETLLLRAVAIAFTGLLAVRLLLACMAREQGGWVWAELAGAALGIGVLLKSSNAVFALTALAVTAWSARRRPARAAGLVLVAVAGIFIVFVPLVVRNVAVGVAPLRMAATGPINFINGNAADRRPGAGSAVSRHAVRILEETGGDSAAVIAATLATHVHAGSSWPRLLAGKFAVFWQDYEIPNNASYSYFLEHAKLLSRLTIGFGVLAPLAVFGSLLAVRRQPLSVVPLAYIGVGIAVSVVFYNLSRFRLPIACMMLPMAGYGLSALFRAAASRRLAILTFGLLTVAGLGVATRAWHLGGANLHRLADYGVHNQISEHLARREPSPIAALAIVERQLATEPASLTTIVPGPQPTTIDVELAGVAGTFVTLHEMAAELLTELGRGIEAQRHFGRAAVLRALNAPYQEAPSRP